MQIAKDMFKQTVYSRVRSWVTDMPEHLEISMWTNETITRFNTAQTTRFEQIIAQHSSGKGIRVKKLLQTLDVWSPNFRLLEILDRRSGSERRFAFRDGSHVSLVCKPRSSKSSLLWNEDDDEPMSAWFNNDKNKDVLFTVKQFLGPLCHGFEYQTTASEYVQDIWFASGMKTDWPAVLSVEFMDGKIVKISQHRKQD